MPTLEERVTILETTLSDVQAQVILCATSNEVAAFEAARSTALESQQDATAALAVRVGKLERALATFQLLLARIPRKNEDGYIPDDLPFAEGVGPVLLDEDGGEWRLSVDTDGELTAVSV